MFFYNFLLDTEYFACVSEFAETALFSEIITQYSSVSLKF